MAAGSLAGQDTDCYCYCYCVVRSDASLDLRELAAIVGGLPPYGLKIGALQAVVSRVPLAEYGEEGLRANLQRTDWVETAVLGHEGVVEGCLRQTGLVPMKFCTLFRSEGDLAAALGERQDEVLSKLRDLNGKQEWGIRLVADRYRLQQHLLDHNPGLLALREGAAAGSAGAAYFLRKRLEDRLAHAMERARADAAEEAYVGLAAVAFRAVLLKASVGASPGAEPVLNAAFLVLGAELSRLLERAEQILSDRPWLRCKTSGPWPPYNFV